MSSPSDYKFNESHEYARRGDDGNIYVGISAYAVDQLQREIVYLELPPVGRELAKGDAFGLVEAVKAASDIYAPVSGKVVAVNDAAVEDPMLVAKDPWGAGWLIQIEPSNPADFTALMDAAAYDEFCQKAGH